MSKPFKEHKWTDILQPCEDQIHMTDNGIYPLVSIKRRNGGFFQRETKFGKKILTKTLSKLIPTSFVISRMQVVHGACSYAPEEFNGTFLSASYVQLLPKKPVRIDTKYLHYYSHLQQSYNAFLKSSHGVHIEKMTFDMNDWMKQKVSLPSLAEQKKIVSILSSVDELISKTQLEINKLQDLNKSVANELLTKGIGHTEFKDSELGKIPKIWKLYTIGQLGEVVGGGTPTSDNLKYWDGTVMWATPTDINKLKGRYIKETVKTLTEEGLRNSSAKLHPIGTILLTSRASIGFPAITLLPMATNQGFQSLRPNENLDTEYGYQVLLHNKHNLKRLSAGSTFLEISSKEIKQFKLPIPPLSEQKKIASILISINNLIEKKERQLDKIQSLKKSLLQDLLTGKIRVAVN